MAVVVAVLINQCADHLISCHLDTAVHEVKAGSAVGSDLKRMQGMGEDLAGKGR